MKQRKPNLNKDKKLEQLVVEIQCSLSKVKSILNDYIYLDSPGTHLCLVKRNRIRFYNALQKEVTILKSQIYEFETNICKKNYTENHLARQLRQQISPACHIDNFRFPGDLQFFMQ